MAFVTCLACGKSGSSEPGPSQKAAIASIVVTPSSSTLESGKTQQLAAAAKDSSGNTLSGITFTWRSDASSVAAVDGTGLVTGALAGTAAITASAQGVTSAAVKVTVNPGPLASIAVNPASVQIAVGDSDASLSAAGSDANGNVIAGLAFDWKSDNLASATVQAAKDSSTAAVHAVAANGEQTVAAQVTASVGDIRGSTAVTVKPRRISDIAVKPNTAAIHVGQTQTFTAVAFWEDNSVPGVSFAWKSSDPDVVTVNEKTGVATGLAPGKATIMASARGIISKPGGALTVAKAIVVSVTPSSQSVTVTKVLNFKVEVANALKDSTVSWSADGGSIRSTSATTALYTAPCRSGPFHVVATSNEDKSKSGSATVNITVPLAGSLDPCFNQDGLVTTSIGPSAVANAIGVQPDGKIVVVGKASDGTKMNFAVARYTPAGALDVSFGEKGFLLTDFGAASEARAVALQDDGKIVTVGSTSSQFAIARYTAEGNADTTFNSSGSTPGRLILRFGLRATNSASAVIVQKPSGRIVVAGSSRSLRCSPRIGCEVSAGFALVGLKPDGTIDVDFGGGPRVTPIGDGTLADLRALAVQSDGKLVGAGSALDPASANPAFALLRWTATGTVDTQFGPGGDGTALLALGDDASANAAVIQPDQKILLAGRAHPVGSMRGDSFALARFTAAGKLDSTFGSSGSVLTAMLGSDDSLQAMQLQKDGKIVLAGEARDAATRLLRFTVLRYTSAGVLDRTFADGGAAVAPFEKLDASAAGIAFTGAAGLSDNVLITVAGSYGTQFALARYWP